MRLTIPHFFEFGPERTRVGPDLVRPSAWDAIRESDGAFGLPRTRADWERRALRPELERTATDLADLVRSLGARSLCSYGVGTGDLELSLARLAPELELTCTEYAPRTAERLALLFPEARVLRHDLLESGPLAADVHLLYRIDTEFSDDDLRTVLARFREPVVLVPALLLNSRTLARELFVRLRRRGTRAGWVRTEARLRELWAPAHDEPIGLGGSRGYVILRAKEYGGR